MLSSSDRPNSLTGGAVRHRQLAQLIARLHTEGSVTLRSQADRLGVTVGALRAYVGGTPLPDEVARDVEWTLHLNPGWMDGDAALPEGHPLTH